MARYHTRSQIWPTHLSEDTLLCLRPSHSAVMPSVVNLPRPNLSTPQSWLSSKLPGKSNERFQESDMARCHTCWRGGVPMGALWQIHSSLARLKGGRCRQQLGKHECFRHANSFSIQVELR